MTFKNNLKNTGYIVGGLCGAKSWLIKIFGFLLLMGLSACAVRQVLLQPQINTLVSAGYFKKAAETIDSSIDGYGPKNELLYLLDRGVCLQMAGDVQGSIRAFERAKIKLDTLYTRSLRDLAASWIINDNRSPYRGEDFEHVLVHVFQAMNFMSLADRNEALVEVRAAANTLALLNDLYPNDQKGVYRDDAFMRLLMGILWEGSADPQDLQDAALAYKKSLDIYESVYSKNFSTAPPRILIENLLVLANHLRLPEFKQYKDLFGNIPWTPLEARRQKGEIYLLHFNGLSPIKHPALIPLLLPGGILTQIAFPQYDTRFYEIAASTLTATDSQGQAHFAQSELAENIEAIAIKSLKDRRARVYAKAILRPAGKYVLEKSLTETVRTKNNDLAGAAVQGAGIWYNLYSEQADLRSWQTLPAQVRLARLVLEPGTYSLKAQMFNTDAALVEERDLSAVTIRAGEQKFFMIRTVR